jgi:hypothetical protein
MPLKFFTEERAVVVFVYWFGNENAASAVAQNRRCNPRRRFPYRHINHGGRGESGHEGRTTGVHIGYCKAPEKSKSSSCLFTFHLHGPDCVSRSKALILRGFATCCNTVTFYDVIRTVCCKDLDVPYVTHFRCAPINRCEYSINRLAQHSHF